MGGDLRWQLRRVLRPPGRELEHRRRYLGGLHLRRLRALRAVPRGGPPRRHRLGGGRPDRRAKETLLYCCQPGRDLLSAGYVMYSSSTVLVLSVGDGVVGFTLDNLIGDFVMTHADIKIPETGKIYSFNEGNAANWSEGLKNYMSPVKAPEGEGSSPYSARYIGSLVGDFHRTMLYGGIYGYPGDKKNVNGKLRLIYECAPM